MYLHNGFEAAADAQYEADLQRALIASNSTEAVLSRLEQFNHNYSQKNAIPPQGRLRRSGGTVETFFFGPGVHENLNGADIELQETLALRGDITLQADFYPFQRFSTSGSHIYVMTSAGRKKINIDYFFVEEDDSQSTIEVVEA